LGRGYCSPRVEEEGELKNEEKASVRELGNDGGSGGAPVWPGTQAPGAARLRWRLPLVNKHHVRVMIVFGEEKGKAAMHFTDGDTCTAAGRSRGGGAGGIGLTCVEWCAVGAKGRRRRSSASLYRGAGR
jgi:hypothetical protein